MSGAYDWLVYSGESGYVCHPGQSSIAAGAYVDSRCHSLTDYARLAADRNPNPDYNTHTDSNPQPNRDHDTHTNSHASPYPYTEADAYSHTKANSYTGSHGAAYPDSRPGIDPYSNCHTHAGSSGNANTAGIVRRPDAHSAAPNARATSSSKRP